MLLPESVLWHNKDIFSAGWERSREGRKGGRDRRWKEGRERGNQKMNSSISVFFVKFCSFFSKIGRPCNRNCE